MITFGETERNLARLEVVRAVSAIPGADRVERVTIDGWNVVAAKGEFTPGSYVVYFEIDACLPMSDHRFSFLAKHGTKSQFGDLYHRLKTKRLCNVYSQGLILPAVLFADELERPEPLVKTLGIGKWEDELPVGTNIIGPFSHMVSKTDSERIQNLVGVWDDIAAVEWVATEKIDGTSQTLLNNDGIHLYSRNYEIELDESQAGGKVATAFAVNLPAGHGVQYELAGPSIQGNPLKLTQAQGFIFSYLIGRTAVPMDQWPQWALYNAVPVLMYDPTIGPDLLLSKVDGMLSRVNPMVLGEGVVFHTADGSIVPALGRNTFKVISNKYLDKGR